MKSLNYIACSEINEFDLIVNSKQKDSRARLIDLRPLVKTNYDTYENSFAEIHQIGESTFDDDEKEDLLGCYLSPTKPLGNLLNRIIAAQTLQFKHVCPYCLLIPRTTFDHYIPEGQHPAFSVFAKNLVPCCTICNGKKLSYWRSEDSRGIIHFYNDLIPEIQFLFGNLSFNDDVTPSIEFELHHRHGIAPDLFEIISLHFDRLELLKRYKESVEFAISDITDGVDSNIEELKEITLDSIKRVIKNRSNKFKLQFGLNYWKSIIMDLLADSEVFLNSLGKRLLKQ
jgi:5-methylcytosine-specific restriction endonuclease McrA